MNSPPADSAPIFVVGTGRSGTTLLRMMLNAHPHIYLTHEASFYLSTAGFKTETSLADWLNYYARTPSFAWLRLSAASIHDQLPAGARCDRWPLAFQALMREKAGQYQKPRYGDKTPLHGLYLSRILKDFDSPRIIHVVRDPRGAVASLMRMPWAPSSVYLNAHYCDQQVKAVLAQADHIHELRLEDLLADPRSTMSGVLQYIGEDWDDAVLDHARHAPADDMPPFPWFEGARRNLDVPTGAPAWQEQLSPAWIRIIEEICSLTMERYQYPRADLPREASSLRRACARLGEGRKIASSLHRLRRFARMYSNKKTPDPQAGMEVLLSINPKAWSLYPGFSIPPIPKAPPAL
ncbi:MAG: sulfotransferase [Deltaproteobacteria bacterium]|nr:sulfotransferase [Deltaproteobacteria bacterium]